jgi:hypothetical protein
LRRYQKAVQRDMERGALSPMKLSGYLESLRVKKAMQTNGMGALATAVNGE